MGNRSSQSEESLQSAAVSKQKAPLQSCGTKPLEVVPAAHYVLQLRQSLEKTVDHSGCGVGSHRPVGSGGALNPNTLQLSGALAPEMSRDRIQNLPRKRSLPRLG